MTNSWLYLNPLRYLHTHIVLFFCMHDFWIFFHTFNYSYNHVPIFFQSFTMLVHQLLQDKSDSAIKQHPTSQLRVTYFNAWKHFKKKKDTLLRIPNIDQGAKLQDGCAPARINTLTPHILWLAIILATIIWRNYTYS